ncbi:ATP-binding protein [Pseudoalteromonas denitrificans]|uniref:histidine kinase n=1 Tax=Pseudoalteromonas denitrificans DSM 6059 TaxID=1123010 RepID=A0A1I1RNQ3_9GAMM|nr:ATP-binding protein [Pseudoalteromonas denitrificans]SFD32090.1 PAS domain S-box-containing protein [Pseudoalteromonas denitrificans DSM 6059]
MLKTIRSLLIFIFLGFSILGLNKLFLSEAQFLPAASFLIQALSLACLLALVNLLRLNYTKSEKLFWQFLLLAITSSVILNFFPLDGFNQKNQLLINDYSYLLFYLFSITALAMNPNLGVMPISKIAVGLIPRSIFIVACFSYFIILPANFSPSSYISYLPSHYFYILIDILIIIQILYHLRYTVNHYWKWVYICLCLAFFTLTISHVLGIYKRLNPSEISFLSYQYSLITLGLILILGASLLLKEVNKNSDTSIKTNILPSYNIIFFMALPIIHILAIELKPVFLIENLGQSLITLFMLLISFIYLYRLIQLQQKKNSKIIQKLTQQQEINQHLISEITHLNTQITYSEEKAIVRASNNAILTCDTQGKILSANPAAVQLFQRLEDELIQCNASDLFVADDEMKLFFNFQSNLHSLQRNEIGISKECIALRSDLNVFPVQAELQWAERAEQPLVVLTFIDLTSRKLTEQKNLESKDNFIANISHELRTPLTIINGIIDHQLTSTTHQSEIIDLTTAKRNGLRLVRMVEQLLELSRLADTPPIEKLTYSLKSLMNMPLTSFSRLATQSHLTFDFNITEDAYIECDAQSFEKIIFNLLSNAIKYTPKGGTVKVEVYAEHNEIFINVIDTGIGINSNLHDKIFQRFHRADEVMNKGTFGVGIGLSLVNELVKIHGWRLNLISEEGVGSRFTLVIPVSSQPQNEHIIPHSISEQEVSSLIIQQPQEQTIKKPHSQQVVLVIEDNADMQTHIKRVIEQQHHCIITDTGENGIELAKTTIPDIIVCDLMLPGIDGFATLTALKEHELTNHIPVILLTARGDLDSRISGFELKADEYLSKPFNQQELLARINSLIENRKQLKTIHLSHALKNQQKTNKKEALDNAIELSTDKSQLMSQTDKFLVKLAHITSELYTNMDLDIHILSKELAVSERQLQRKLKTLLDMSPNNYIKEFRLGKAKERLLNGEQIGQVALTVGFTSQTYFGRCFKERFSCTPKQYQKEHCD